MLFVNRNRLIGLLIWNMILEYDFVDFATKHQYCKLRGAIEVHITYYKLLTRHICNFQNQSPEVFCKTGRQNSQEHTRV